MTLYMTRLEIFLLSSRCPGVSIALSKLITSLCVLVLVLIDSNSLHVQLNDLGSRYAKVGLSDKVALATINVDANDVPIQIDSYPSVRLYRAGTNEMVSFQGNFKEILTVERLDAFISQSGGHRVSIMTLNEGGTHDEL